MDITSRKEKEDMQDLLEQVFSLIYLPMSSEGGESRLPVGGYSKSSLKESGGVAGHTKGGFSMGITGGSTSPVRTLKAILMDGLWYGLG